MNTKTLDSRKINLIVQITHLDNEKSVCKVEDFVNHLERPPTKRQSELLNEMARPIREKLDLDELIREQNWKPSTREGIDELIEKIDFQISHEELIRELNDI